MRRDRDGRIVELEPAEFGARLEDYFGGKYTPAQMDEVGRWAKHKSARALGLVYRYCTLNEDTRYGKPPTIHALNRNMAEVYDSYPELAAASYNRQIAIDQRLIEEEGWTREQMAENLRKLAEMLDPLIETRFVEKDGVS